MSIPLLKLNVKKNIILFIIFFSVLTMYLGVMISMFNPDNLLQMNELLSMMPDSITQAFGMSGLYTDLTGYLASYLYGLLMFGFPLVYCIILGNRLVSKMVDNGSFAYLLSTPNSRTKIIGTQLLYGLCSILLLFAIVTKTGILIAHLMFPNELLIKEFILLNAYTMLVNMGVFSIVFFFSCLFNDSSKALSYGAGIPVLFLLMNMLGGTNESIGWLKDFSLYGLYNPLDLASGSVPIFPLVLLLSIIIILSICSILVFKHKRLPI